MTRVTHKTVNDVIELSRLLGEFGQIRRATLLPNGEPESDSHHSFSLALIAFELAAQYAPHLDSQKILLYSLVHDLPELESGDVVTLTATTEELHAKEAADAIALAAIKKRLARVPHIMSALEAYEAKADEESLFVYWVDKMVTIPTHFLDEGTNLKALGAKNRSDIKGWYERTLQKLQRAGPPAHVSAVQVLELAYKKMHDELLAD